MTIESAQPSDLSEIENLFLAGFGADGKMYPIRKAKHLFVAKDKERIVGAGGLFLSVLHGQVPRAVIAVDSEYRRKGVGSKIHEAIVQSRPVMPLGIDGCCYDNDVPATSFMIHLGYQLYLDCFIPVVDTSAGFASFQKPEKLRLLNFDEAASIGIDKSILLRFLVDRYIATHEWSPVTLASDSPQWEAIAFSGIDNDVSLVAVIEGNIVGVSTAGIENEVLEIRWPFAVAATVEVEEGLLKAMIEQQLSIANGKGIKTSTFECDSTEKAMLYFPKTLKILKSETWSRFRFKN